MNFNVLSYRRRILNKISEYGDLKEVGILLDVGCGDGGDCELFSESAKNIVGTDISFHKNGIEIMKRYENISFIVCDACNLPFSNETLDYIHIKDALHHIKNHEKTLTEIIRVTKIGGKIVIVEANRYNPIFYIHMTSIEGHQHFSKNYFYRLIEKHFNNFMFFTVESHVYPVNNKSIILLLNSLENLLEKIPILRNYLSYNIVVAIKRDEK